MAVYRTLEALVNVVWIQNQNNIQYQFSIYFFRVNVFLNISAIEIIPFIIHILTQTSTLIYFRFIYGFDDIALLINL